MKINRKYKIEQAVSSDRLKPALNNVKMYSRRLVATDGHIMAVIPFKKADNGITELNVKGLIPPEVFTAARKANKKTDKEYATIEHDGTDIGITDIDKNQKSNFQTVDEPYPDVVRVIPRCKTEYCISFTVKNLVRLAKAIGAEQVTLEFHGETKGIIVRPNDKDNNAWGLLMPVRTK